MRLKNLDLAVIMPMAIINVLLTLLPGRIPVLSIMFALPLAFVLPGYALSEALLYNCPRPTSYRLLLCPGLSLATVILSGLFLNILPVGLQAGSWAVTLTTLTCVFSLLALYARRNATVPTIHRPRISFNMRGFILLGMAVIIAALSILLAATGIAQQPHPGFTQLWALPLVQPGKSCAVRLGVQSFESAPVTYRLTMTMNNAQKTLWSSITLSPQQVWDWQITAVPEASGKVSVDVELYQLNEPRVPYRNAHLTLLNCPPLKATPHR